MAKPTANFNGSDLATVVPGLRILSSDPYRPGPRQLSSDSVANSDKGVNSGAYFKGMKKLNVTVEIGRDTRELLDDAVDTLLSYLIPREKTLLLSVGSGTRQWTASYSNMGFSDVQGGHAVIDIEFEAADGIGIDTASTSLFSTSLTGSSSTTPFVVPLEGSMQFQQPIITITLNSVTLNGSTGTMTIGNPANGMSIIISARVFAANDVIVIDSKLKKVTVNGTEVAFTGSIPEWERGSGSMDYSDTFTARNRTMTGLYYKRYA